VNWDEVLVGATAVVSTLGGFGSEEQMQRINGEANVVSVNAAKDYGNEMPIWLRTVNSFGCECCKRLVVVVSIIYINLHDIWLRTVK
jgi:hypothetical protein